MQQTTWDDSARNFPSPQEEIPPATSEPTPVCPLQQHSALDATKTYYAYHLGRVVQQHHDRLFSTYYPAVDRN
jgi:hypothetical protein